MDFGTRLCELRASRGYSQRQLATRAALDSGYVNRLEHGVYGPPKAATILRLSRALALSPTEEAELFNLAGRTLPLGQGATDTWMGPVAESRIALAADETRHVDEIAGTVQAAIAARQRGKAARARRLLERDAIPALRAQGPSIAFAEALSALGDVFRASRNIPAAEDAFLAAKGVLAELQAAPGFADRDAAVVQDAQTDWALAKLGFTVGNVALARIRIDRAWSTLDMIAEQSVIDLDPPRSICAQVIGRVYQAEQDIVQARAWLERSLSYSEHPPFTHTRAETGLYLLLLLEEHRQAFDISLQQLIHQAEDLLVTATSAPFPLIAATTELALARLYNAAGRSARAEQYRHRALILGTATPLRFADPDVFDEYQRALGAA